MQKPLDLANFPHEASYFFLLTIKAKIISSFSAASSKQGYLGEETKGRNKKAWRWANAPLREGRDRFSGWRMWRKGDGAISGHETNGESRKNGWEKSCYEVPGEEVTIQESGCKKMIMKRAHRKQEMWASAGETKELTSSQTEQVEYPLQKLGCL